MEKRLLSDTGGTDYNWAVTVSYDFEQEFLSSYWEFWNYEILLMQISAISLVWPSF